MPGCVRSLTAVVGLAACSAVVLAVPVYHVEDIGSLGGGQSWAYDINDAGQIVGSYQPGSGNSYAFLFDNDVFTNISGASDGVATAINNSGVAVGYAGGSRFAFKWSGGVFTNLGLNGANDTSYAYGVNDSGNITGYRHLVGGGETAFLSDHVPSDLGTDGGTLSQGYAVNNNGNVVGYFRKSDLNQAFFYSSQTGTFSNLATGVESYALSINENDAAAGYAKSGGVFRAVTWSSGAMTVLAGSAAYSESRANHISDDGTVVGWVADAVSGRHHAALWWDGNLVDLNSILGAVSSEAASINGNGQIVGFYEDATGYQRAFKLSTVPEPFTMGLGCAGIALALWRRKRRHIG